MSVTPSNPHRNRFMDSLRRLGFWTLATSSAVMICLLCIRRISGAFVNPLGIGAIALHGIVIVAIALAIRFAGKYEASSEPMLRWLTSAFVVLAAIAVSVPGSPTLGLIVLWVLVGIEEGLSFRNLLPSRPSPASVLLRVASQADEAVDDQTITQNLVRRREADGSDTIHGWVRATFAAGERTVVSHVAFCPPMARIPNCSVEPGDGPPLRVKVTQVLPHGVRFEIKLDQPSSEPQTATIEFSATTGESEQSLLLG